MARFFGEIGYAGDTVKVGPGKFVEQIVEYTYSGDLVRNSRNLVNGESVNDDVSVTNSISIVADAYANEHIFAMRYVRWQGALWKIVEVEVVRPRLLLRLGGVYNGPKAGTTSSP
jgi:hypothetical protein